MTTYGQFCSFARSLDLLGERWTLLIVRELLSGSTRFNDIRRGIPRISRTMLSARLRDLVDSGVVARGAGRNGPTYELTREGQELAASCASSACGDSGGSRALSRGRSSTPTCSSGTCIAA